MRRKDAVRAALDDHHLCAGDGVGGSPGLFIRGGGIGCTVDESSHPGHFGKPVLSNLYLTEVDRMLEKAIATTRYGKYTYVQYARFADDLVILVDSYPRHQWLVKAVERRLREELIKLRVEINEDKSRIVDLAKDVEFLVSGL